MVEPQPVIWEGKPHNPLYGMGNPPTRYMGWTTPQPPYMGGCKETMDF